MEVVHTVVPRITPSSINDLECAKKFYTLRIARQWPDREPFYSVAIGTAVHEVLRNLYRDRKGSTIDLSNLLALTKTAVYHVRFPKDTNLIEAAQKVMNCVRTYVNNDDEEDIEGTIDVERESEFPLMHKGKMLCLVSAKLDRIVERASNPSVLVVKNYKTTKPKVDLKQAFIELWVAKQRYGNYSNYVLEYDWITEETVDRSVVEGSVMRGMHRMIVESATKVLTATDFPEQPGDCCTYCPIRTQCQQLPPFEFHEDEEIF